MEIIKHIFLHGMKIELLKYIKFWKDMRFSIMNLGEKMVMVLLFSITIFGLLTMNHTLYKNILSLSIFEPIILFCGLMFFLCRVIYVIMYIDNLYLYISILYIIIMLINKKFYIHMMFCIILVLLHNSLIKLLPTENIVIKLVFDSILLFILNPFTLYRYVKETTFKKDKNNV